MKSKNLNDKTNSKSQEIMVDYLIGNNASLQKYEVEDAMMKDPFISDAIEGLYGNLNNQELDQVKNKLNNFISNKVRNQKYKANKPLSFPLWIVLLSFVLLVISIAGYVIIRFMLK
jgi:hypothetical protein